MNVDPPPLPPLNPYAAPSANLAGAESFAPPEAVSARSVQLLQRTRPWVLLIAAVMMIVTALILIAAVAAAMAGARTRAVSYGVGVAAAYGVTGIIMLLIATSMLRYSSAIGRLIRSRSTIDLHAALDAQRRIWFCFGLLTLLYIVFVAIAVAGGALAWHLN